MRSKKHSLNIILIALLALLICLGSTAMAKTEVASGTCGANLTWTLDSEGTLTISGTGAMYDYYYNTIPWYYNKSNISTVVIQSGVTAIGNYAFCECHSLTDITIPNSVTAIGDYAFYWCNSLTNVNIPNSIVTIGNYAFNGCARLTDITIPNSVTSIGNRAFGECNGLTNISVDSANTYYVSNDGVLFNKDSTSLIAYPAGKTAKTYSIPSSVTAIGHYAFTNCNSLTDITIPNSVTAIGDSAFFYCAKLTSVTIPNSVTAIGYNAFANCDSLVSITIPNSVTTISDWAFHGCESLTDVYFIGTDTQWQAIEKGSNNETLLSAEIHYISNDIITIPTTMEMKSGEEYTIPVYISYAGELESCHFELDIPAASFSNISVATADANQSFYFDQNYTGGVLYVSASSASDINPGSGKALFNITLTPADVTQSTDVYIKLHDIRCNESSVSDTLTATATITPQFSVTAIIKYFAKDKNNSDKPVSGVTVTAGSSNAASDSNGQAIIGAVSGSTVTVSAAKNAYITGNKVINSNDAVLILKDCVKLITLDDNQKLAGDVNGDGKVTEYDASQILKYSVGSVSSFTAGSWKFTPNDQKVTPDGETTNVNFLAVLIGDVDGSWANYEESK